MTSDPTFRYRGRTSIPWMLFASVRDYCSDFYGVAGVCAKLVEEVGLHEEEIDLFGGFLGVELPQPLETNGHISFDFLKTPNRRKMKPELPPIC